MKNKILLTLLIVFAPALALADVVKLKHAQLQELSIALSALDGAQKVVPQGEAPAKVVHVAYEFGGKTRLAIARNLSALRRTLEEYEATRVQLLNQVSNGQPDKVQGDTALSAKFYELWRQATAEPAKIDLTLIKTDDLRLDANAIPGSILSALTPVLSDK